MTDAPQSQQRARPGPADPPRPAAGGQRGDTLGLRLALAFLGVALAAVALIAILTAVFSAVDVSSLASRQRSELASAFAVAAASSWQHDQRWVSAGLAPTLDLAAHSGVQLQVRDEAGHAVAATSGFTSATGPEASAPVLVNGRQVGSVRVSLTASGLGAADAILRTALLRAIAGTAGLAALLALAAGLGVSRRITRPVARLIAVTRAMASGDRSSRAGEIKAPGELRELAAAFDHKTKIMSDVRHVPRTNGQACPEPPHRQQDAPSPHRTRGAPGSALGPSRGQALRRLRRRLPAGALSRGSRTSSAAAGIASMTRRLPESSGVPAVKGLWKAHFPAWLPAGRHPARGRTVLA